MKRGSLSPGRCCFHRCAWAAPCPGSRAISSVPSDSCVTWRPSRSTVRPRAESMTPPHIQLVDPRPSLQIMLEQALAQRPEIGARGADVAYYETRLRQERIRPLAPALSVGLSAGSFGGGSDQVGYRFSHF